jgi:hypothetical protein
VSSRFCRSNKCDDFRHSGSNKDSAYFMTFLEVDYKEDLVFIEVPEYDFSHENIFCYMLEIF